MKPLKVLGLIVLCVSPNSAEEVSGEQAPGFDVCKRTMLWEDAVKGKDAMGSPQQELNMGFSRRNDIKREEALQQR